MDIYEAVANSDAIKNLKNALGICLVCSSPMVYNEEKKELYCRNCNTWMMESSEKLVKKLDLVVEPHKTASIGKSKKDGKWYGWSHRAYYGFGVGSTCKKGDAHYKGKEWTAKTDEDAKQMAIDFSEGVS